jgi:hypothetical protein
MAPNRETCEQLGAVTRYLLWDYSDKSRLAKVTVPIGGLGMTNRAGATWALFQQFHFDSAGIAHRRAGIAITLNARDATRFAALLAGAGTAAPVPGAPAGTPQKKRTFTISVELSDALDAYCEAHSVQIKEVLDAALRG